MSHYQEKRKKNRILYSPLVILGLFILLIFMSVGVVNMYAKNREAAQNRERAMAEYQKLVERETMLSDDIATLQTPEGIEENLRETYHVAKTGEELIIITDPVVEVVDESETKSSFWNFFKKIFKK